MGPLRMGRRTDGLSWRDEGEEPDYRFSLANERTFLAWIRTALAVMAAAVAVVQLVPEPNLHGSRRLIGLLLAGIGLIISASVYRRWAATERAMRNRRPLPHTPLLHAVAAVLAVVGVIVVVIAAVG